MKKSIVESLFRENHGVMTTKELLDNGVTYYTMNQLLDSGFLSKIRRGVYTVSNESEEEIEVINKLIPKGILCMQSAAIVYDYTSKMPLRYHIAIDSKSKYSLPDYPKIKLYYWKKNQKNLGVQEVEINGIKTRIYDKEKTICDYIKFRNKLDFSEVKEVLSSYLRDNDRNISRLSKYSKELKIKNVLNHYLESII